MRFAGSRVHDAARRNYDDGGDQLKSRETRRARGDGARLNRSRRRRKSRRESTTLRIKISAERSRTCGLDARNHAARVLLQMVGPRPGNRFGVGPGVVSRNRCLENPRARSAGDVVRTYILDGGARLSLENAVLRSGTSLRQMDSASPISSVYGKEKHSLEN